MKLQLVFMKTNTLNALSLQLLHSFDPTPTVGALLAALG